MIINKDGKLFGKISVIDILAVLIIVVLIAGIASRFSGKSNVVVSSGEKIKCTFLVKNVREYTADALKQGGPVYDKTSKEYIGEIVDVKQTEGKFKVNMADGSFKDAVPQEKYNVYVTVEFSGKSGSNGFYTAANKFLGAGTSTNIITKYAECGASVYLIEAE